MSSKLRIIVDLPLCCGYGACKEACPEVFQLGQGGLVSLLTDIVPEGLEDKATEAVEMCPQMALAIESIED